MKHAVVLAACAALALTACEKAETAAEPTASALATEAAAPAASAAAAAPAGAAAFTAGEGPSKEFMVGTWGEGDACELPINFQADGTIKDGPFPKWSLANGELTMEGAPEKLKLKVIDANTMESVLGDGKPLKLKRC